MLNKYPKNENVQDFEPTRLSLEDKLKKKGFASLGCQKKYQ